MKGNFALYLTLLLIAVSMPFVGLARTGLARAQSNSPYDVNGDGVVDILDIEKWAMAFGTFEGESDFNPNVDLHRDGVIDVFDALLIALHFGE